MPKLAKKIFLAVVALGLGGQSSPQPSLQELLAPHAHPIALEQGRLVGAGADMLIGEAGKSQFLALAEDHNHRDIPAITASLFKTLHSRFGYNYFADEQDPVMMRIISSPPVRGSREQVEELARTYKHGFTFISDQELRMLAEIATVSNGKGRPIWGCEQAFGVTHILDQLRPRAPGPEARGLIASLRTESHPSEANRDLAKGHYIAREDLGPRLEDLAQAFAGADPETRFIAEAPRQSNLIYSYYNNAVRGVLPGAHSNSSVREEYMKSICLDEYRYAMRQDGDPPKLLLKFGHWHLYDGVNPNNVTTLGNFFANLARINGTRYTSLAMFPSASDGRPIWENERVAYLRAFGDVVPAEGWRLIDMRPLREGPALREMRAVIADLAPSMREELHRLIYGFDFVMFLGPSARATFEIAQVEY